MTGELKSKKPSTSKWSINHVPNVPEETAQRFSDLYRSRVNPEHLRISIKSIVQQFKYSNGSKRLHNARFQSSLLSPAELARVRLINLSYLHCDEFSLNILDAFRAMSEHRILAHKHDLSLMPEKLELARSFIRIASAANSNIRRAEWGSKEFAVLVKKYQHHTDDVVRSIIRHQAIDDRLIEAEIAGIHGALHQGAL